MPLSARAVTAVSSSRATWLGPDPSLGPGSADPPPGGWTFRAATRGAWPAMVWAYGLSVMIAHERFIESLVDLVGDDIAVHGACVRDRDGAVRPEYSQIRAVGSPGEGRAWSGQPHDSFYLVTSEDVVDGLLARGMSGFVTSPAHPDRSGRRWMSDVDVRARTHGPIDFAPRA